MAIFFRSISVMVVVLVTLSTFAAIESGKKEFVLDFEAINKGLIDKTDYAQARRISEDRYRQSLATMSGNDYELLDAVRTYSLVLVTTASRADARDSLKRMVSELESKFGKNTYGLTYVLSMLGGFQKGAEQVATFQRALQIQRTVYPDSVLDYAGLAQMMAFAYTYDTRQYGHALQMLGVAIPVYESYSGRESEEVMFLRLAVGRAYAGFEATDLVSMNNATALAIAETLDNEILLAEAWFLAGQSLALIPENLDATEYLDTALDRFEQHFGVDHRRTAVVSLDVAMHSINSGNPTRASGLLQRSLAVFKEEPGNRNWERDTLKLLVEAHEDLGQRDEATKYCLEISRIDSRVDNQDYQPVLKRAPEYPKTAVANGEEGYVLVEYTVDEYGFVQSPKIIESEGPESFHDVSITASYLFRYAPRLENDVPVATPGVKNKFTFKFSN